MKGMLLDDDATLLHELSDRETFERVLAAAFHVPPEDARAAAARLFYHFMDPWGRLLDRVVDEGDPRVFSREDRRDLVHLANLGIVAVRSTEVTKLDVRGRGKTFTQYHYALHLDAIRLRLVEAAGALREDRHGGNVANGLAPGLDARGSLRAAAVPGDEDEEADAGAHDVYADPSLWSRRRA